MIITCKNCNKRSNKMTLFEMLLNKRPVDPKDCETRSVIPALGWGGSWIMQIASQSKFAIERWDWINDKCTVYTYADLGCCAGMGVNYRLYSPGRPEAYLNKNGTLERVGWSFMGWLRGAPYELTFRNKPIHTKEQ